MKAKKKAYRKVNPQNFFFPVDHHDIGFVGAAILHHSQTPTQTTSLKLNFAKNTFERKYLQNCEKNYLVRDHTFHAAKNVSRVFVPFFFVTKPIIAVTASELTVNLGTSWE